MTLRNAILLSLAAVAWTGSAEATFDYKAYNGAFCQPEVGTITYFNTGVTCTSANCGTICPFVRDRISDADTISDVSVEINNVASSTFSCTIYMMDDDANSGTDVDASNKGTSATGRQQLSWTTTDLDADPSDEGSYVMACSFQQNDILYQMLVVEDQSSGGTE